MPKVVLLLMVVIFSGVFPDEAHSCSHTLYQNEDIKFAKAVGNAPCLPGVPNDIAKEIFVDMGVSDIRKLTLVSKPFYVMIHTTVKPLIKFLNQCIPVFNNNCDNPSWYEYEKIDRYTSQFIVLENCVSQLSQGAQHEAWVFVFAKYEKDISKRILEIVGVNTSLTLPWNELEPNIHKKAKMVLNLWPYIAILKAFTPTDDDKRAIVIDGFLQLFAHAVPSRFYSSFRVFESADEPKIFTEALRQNALQWEDKIRVKRRDEIMRETCRRVYSNHD